MILLRDIRLAPGEPETRLAAKCARILGVRPEEVGAMTVVRRSLDARRKQNIHWLFSVAVEAPDEQKVLARCRTAAVYEPFHYEIPRAVSASRPVVVGFGPAGMFAALVLAEAGLRPVVLERGRAVEERTADVRRFWETGELSERSNVQFGEGGAGTFSDGKLHTGTHDPRIAFVLRRFHDFGAPERVMFDAKPHVGTDVLARVVRSLRERVIALGGEVRFATQLTALRQEGGRLTAAVATSPGGEYAIPCEDLILAPGHAARDTFAMLLACGVPMARKPFSMGVRIEHSQRWLDEQQYGPAAGKKLPAADYRLNVTLPDGSSAYTFCMCPGGYVVAAASEAGGVCTNGMSYSGRGGENANSALLVTLTPDDFPGDGVLAGMAWQREIERRCYDFGGGNYLAPAQTVGDFLAGRPSAGPGAVTPTYRPGVVWGELRDVLPPRITATLAGALPLLGRKLPGFDVPDAVLTAPETRSSSPVRILRGDDLQSDALTGLYPCGEGAGYAGGITSAAVDGMKCAERIIRKAQRTE